MPETHEAPMIPIMYQAGILEAYHKSLKLFVAYGVLAGFIRIR